MADRESNTDPKNTIQTASEQPGLTSSRLYNLEDHICNYFAASRVLGFLLPDPDRSQSQITLTPEHVVAIQFAFSTMEARFREMEAFLDQRTE